MRRPALMSAGLIAFAGPALAQTGGSLLITGLAGQTETLSAADIAKRPHVQVTLTHNGVPKVYSGPLLTDLLRNVDAPLGEKLHGPALSDVVVATAADKYHVVLSLGELDAGLHPGARVILADAVDGELLDAHEGPFRLVVDGDARPARSAHSVVEIDLKHVP